MMRMLCLWSRECLLQTRDLDWVRRSTWKASTHRITSNVGFTTGIRTNKSRNTLTSWILSFVTICWITPFIDLIHIPHNTHTLLVSEELILHLPHTHISLPVTRLFVALTDIAPISQTVLSVSHQRNDLDPLPTHSTRTSVTGDSDGIGGEGMIPQELSIIPLYSYTRLHTSIPSNLFT